MSSRPIFTPYSVITNGDLSTTLTSKVTIIQNLSMVSYALSWTGAPTASVDVQVSNDYSQNADGTVRNPGTWSSLPLSTTTPVTGSPGAGFIDIDAMAGYALRLVITPSGGSGSLQAVVAGKVA